MGRTADSLPDRGNMMCHVVALHVQHHYCLCRPASPAAKGSIANEQVPEPFVLGRCGVIDLRAHGFCGSSAVLLMGTANGAHFSSRS